MLFCPKCGSILKAGKQKGMLECVKCKHILKSQGDSTLSESVTGGHKKVEIVEEEIQVLPKTPEECPKCKNNEAYYWLQQTRAADEAATKFLRCTKCGHTWRDYS